MILVATELEPRNILRSRCHPVVKTHGPFRSPYSNDPFQVAVAARRVDRLDALVRELRQSGVAGVCAVRMDVCDEMSIKSGVKQVNIVRETLSWWCSLFAKILFFYEWILDNSIYLVLEIEPIIDEIAMFSALFLLQCVSWCSIGCPEFQEGIHGRDTSPKTQPIFLPRFMTNGVNFLVLNV